MVILGFTVTYVRRRQVPNTWRMCYTLPFAESSLAYVDLSPKPAVRQRAASLLPCVLA